MRATLFHSLFLQNSNNENTASGNFTFLPVKNNDIYVSEQSHFVTEKEATGELMNDFNKNDDY